MTLLIAGPRTLEQWSAYLGSLEHSFTAEDEALVNGLVASGTPSLTRPDPEPAPADGQKTAYRLTRAGGQ